MKSSRAIPLEPEQLKPVLLEKIERMNGEQLVLLDRMLLQLEAEQAADRLSEAFDADHAQGKLGQVAELVRQARRQGTEVVMTPELERLLDEGLENLDHARTTDELRYGS